MNLFRRHKQPLIPYGASNVLQEVCEGEPVLSLIVEYLDQFCSAFDVSKDSVIEQALILLACPSQPRRIVFVVLLHCLTARADLAEDVMRHAAHDQMQRCETFTAANDDLIQNRKTKHNISSHCVRRQAVMVSFQLELCLWLHPWWSIPNVRARIEGSNHWCLCRSYRCCMGSLSRVFGGYDQVRTRLCYGL